MRTFTIALPVLLGLTACGAATNPGAPSYQPPPPPPDTYNTRTAERNILLDEFAALPLTESSQLPFSANLGYRGLLNTTLGPDKDVIGNVDMNIDLLRETVSGSAGNFRDNSNRSVDGTLEIFRGTFNDQPGPHDYQAVAGLRGNLTDAFRRDYAVSGQLEGDVLGRNAQAFEGIVTGAVKVDGGPQQGIKGGVVAERVR